MTPGLDPPRPEDHPLGPATEDVSCGCAEVSTTTPSHSSPPWGSSGGGPDQVTSDSGESRRTGGAGVGWCSHLDLLSGAPRSLGLSMVSPEEPEPAGPHEQSEPSAEDQLGSGSGSGLEESPIQDLIFTRSALLPRSGGAGPRSPQNITFTAGPNGPVPEVWGGSGEEPEVERGSREGSGGASGGGTPQAPGNDEEEAEKMSPHQTSAGEPSSSGGSWFFFFSLLSVWFFLLLHLLSFTCVL